MSKDTKTIHRVLDAHTGTPVPGSNLVLKSDSQHEVRITIPDKQWLQGKLTIISSLIAAVAAIGAAFDLHLPVNEINGVFTWLLANWDSIGALVGTLGVIYGSLRKLWQKQPEVKVLN